MEGHSERKKPSIESANPNFTNSTRTHKEKNTHQHAEQAHYGLLARVFGVELPYVPSLGEMHTQRGLRTASTDATDRAQTSARAESCDSDFCGQGG